MGEYIRIKSYTMERSNPMRNLEKAPELLKTAIAEHGGWDGEEAELFKAWKRERVEDDHERRKENLQCSKIEDGKKYNTQETIRTQQESIRMQKEKMLNVGAQPMTMEEASYKSIVKLTVMACRISQML